jgi:hypothetical protein
LSLRQRIVDDEQAVVVDAGQLLHHAVERARPETTSAQVADGAGVAVEAAAARGVEEIHHAHAFVVVEFALEDRPPGRADYLDRRRAVEKVVGRAQLARAQVGEDLLHAALGLAEEHGIGVGLGFFRVQHGGDAAEDDGTPRRRYSSAMAQPRFTCLLSIIEMPMQSAGASKSRGWTFSSTNSTSMSAGRAAAKTTGPCGGRWNSVCKVSLDHFG